MNDQEKRENDWISKAEVLRMLDENGVVFRAEVEKMPTLNVYSNSLMYKPVINAFWVDETDRTNHWHCSNCGKVQGVTCIAMKYCPECGARMSEHPWAASGCGQAFSPD